MGTGGTHTHAASTEDKHIVLTLIKEEETCRLEKTVCVCDGDLQRKLSDAASLNSLTHLLKVFLSALMSCVLLSMCPFCVCVFAQAYTHKFESWGVCMCIHNGGCV